MPDPSSSSSSSTTANSSPTALQLGIMVIVLGSSAGFTLYTRKTGSMLRTMDHIRKNQQQRNPTKFGPASKMEHEKMKTRIDKDEFF